MGELHLDIKVDILRRTYKVDANIGAPQVAFRERVTQRSEVDYTHKKQTGGTGQFARVKIVVEPNEPGKGFEFESKIVGGNVPKEYIPGVEKGLDSVLGAGVVAGFPVVDVKVQLIDGAYHEVDSSALAFEIASRAAFREALQKGKSVLLEPIMKVECVTPEDYTGFGHRRLELAARPDPRSGHARQRQRHQRDGAADEHVRLREHPALDEPGTRDLHDAVRPLRGSAAQRFRRSPEEIRLTRRQ